MSEENEKDDWTKKTDAQLAEAAAELKTRRPLTDLEGQDWGAMSSTEFANNASKGMAAMKHDSTSQRIQKENAEHLAEKTARQK